jgi:hypothetical protein
MSKNYKRTDRQRANFQKLLKTLNVADDGKTGKTLEMVVRRELNNRYKFDSLKSVAPANMEDVSRAGKNYEVKSGGGELLTARLEDLQNLTIEQAVDKIMENYSTTDFFIINVAPLFYSETQNLLYDNTWVLNRLGFASWLLGQVKMLKTGKEGKLITPIRMSPKAKSGNRGYCLSLQTPSYFTETTLIDNSICSFSDYLKKLRSA